MNYPENYLRLPECRSDERILVLLAVQLNLGAGVLAGDDLLALLNFHLDFLAVNNAARAYFDNFSNLGLLPGGCGKNNATLRWSLRLDHLDNYTVAKGLSFIMDSSYEK